MATITGTTGDDRLVGTNADDLIIANGGTDVLLGRGGADTYQLYFSKYSTGPSPYYKINESSGGDGSIDTITGTGSLVQPADFAQFSRVGSTGQHLLIETAFKQNYFSSTGIQSGTIKIVDQHNAAVPTAQVEKYIAGGVEYNLLTTNIGTAFNDIMTGWRLADTLQAGDGDDYVSGGRGRDILSGEGGNDILFGGGGFDTLSGGAGVDRLFGGKGNDRINGGDDNDQLQGDAGVDVLKGNDGDDTLSGGDQNDRLIGGLGSDTLEGGTGDDKLIGNKGGDIYVISSLGGDSDTIIDKGQAPNTFNPYSSFGHDIIRLTGYDTPSEAMHSIGFQIAGDDLILSYENADTPGQTGQITIQDHFAGPRNAIEQITFAGDPGNIAHHISNLRGDDFTYSVHGGADIGGDDIVLGTTGDDQIYGGIGSDMMLGGGGADRFMFHDEEDNRGGTDIILDFDLGNDVLDFTEIKTLTRAGLTVADNSYGNAVVSSIYGAIELKDITTAQVTDAIFDFL